MRPIEVAKMIAVAKMLPSVIRRLRQNGNATINPTSGGTIAARMM